MLTTYKTKTLTITCDNGKEYADHQEFAKALDADVYFAHAYSSWERGSNENANGLSRQYFQKGSDFSKITDQDIKFVEKRLNTRPRKCLNLRTPEMVFFVLSDVALET
jgi:IS30 family transposase